MPNRPFELSELDPETIKTSFKEYLRDQNEFVDYNFEGSGWSVILNVLSQNTHHMAFLANMLGNEMYLDSAAKRDSVVSHAKHLGFTPTSVLAPTAVVDVQVTTTSMADGKALTLSKNTPFSVNLDGTSYTFYTTEDFNATVDSDSATFEDVSLKEGRLTNSVYVVNLQDEDQRFVIPFSNVDTTTLKVVVQNSRSDTTQSVYTLAGNIVEIEDDNKVYWLQEVENGQFEVYFGDGVVGSALSQDNIIILEYIVSNGPDANGAGAIDVSGSRAFVFEGTTGNSGSISWNGAGSIATDDVECVVVTSAEGGSDRQTIDSVRFLAPKLYEAQNRAVTAKDYVTMLKNDYPAIESIYVWGGEDNDPPEYGKVFISIKPFSGSTVSDIEKENIKSDLIETKNVLTVIPEFVDPDYIDIRLTVEVHFNSLLTELSSSAIENQVRSVIEDFGDNELEKFDKKFRSSKLSSAIDETNDSILGNTFTVNMSKTVEIDTSNRTGYEIKFANRILELNSSNAPTVTSTDFTYNDPVDGNVTVRLQDDGAGSMVIVKTSNDEVVSDSFFTGEVDYINGTVTLYKFITASEDSVTIIARPHSEELKTVRNQILRFDTAELTVTAIAEEVDSTQ